VLSSPTAKDSPKRKQQRKTPSAQGPSETQQQRKNSGAKPPPKVVIPKKNNSIVERKDSDGQDSTMAAEKRKVKAQVS
jgi:hypothetical protein